MVHLFSANLNDRALHYGDGLFETIALKHGVMVFWPEHYQRLVQGCARLKFPTPNEAILLQEIDVAKQNLDRAVIKIMITRSASQRGYRIPKQSKAKTIVQAYPYPDFSEKYYQQGISAIFCKTPVSENTYLAGIKHLNRLDNVLASSEWDDDNIAEGLMCNASGQVIQGTKSNLFWAKDNVLYTPELVSSGVKGIMRAQIILWAQQNNTIIKMGTITPKELLAQDEIFVCNSIFGIWPVTNLEGHVFPKGKYAQTLINYFK